jgi:hypothetical protein
VLLLSRNDDWNSQSRVSYDGDGSTTVASRSQSKVALFNAASNSSIIRSQNLTTQQGSAAGAAVRSPQPDIQQHSRCWFDGRVRYTVARPANYQTANYQTKSSAEILRAGLLQQAMCKVGVLKVSEIQLIYPSAGLRN